MPLLVLALAGMAWLYFSSRHMVTVVINDRSSALWTSQTTVRSALVEAGFTWNPEDMIRPGLDEPIPVDGNIIIRLAAPITVEADGNVFDRRTQATTVAGVLHENGIGLKSNDRVYLDGRLVDVNASLPQFAPTGGRVASPAINVPPAHITVARAVPIILNDNGLVSTLYTTEQTLGEALTGAGVQIYLGDDVSPDLGSPVSAGAAVFIRRSRGAEINVDGHAIRTRTRLGTVAALLDQEGIALEGKDYADPAPTSPVLDGMQINVTRVREVFITETEYISFTTRRLPNPDIELDTTTLVQDGNRGIKNRLFKSVYENGQLVSRGLVREWIAQPPQDKIWNYGTKIVLHDLTLPDGRVVQYWRRLRMFATSYTAASSGKTRGDPEYGITFLGLTAGKGIVAVDPRVVNLRSTLYVPGYGVALAGDTGGGIKGRRIDLGYPEDTFAGWYQWVDVYLLAPAPPAKLINYNLPDYPRERQINQ
ncbi:MAG: ubiquitin-like domain-containing protein [Anaerolineae bacterium]